MEDQEQDYKSRTLTTEDGRTIIYFDGKLHSWDEPALRYAKGLKKKDEYYLYGIPHTKEEWLEARRDRHGIPPEKQINVRGRM